MKMSFERRHSNQQLINEDSNKTAYLGDIHSDYISQNHKS